MSLGRPSRRVGILKESKAGTVNLLPVASSSSSIPSRKLGIFLVAPDGNINNILLKTKLPYMHGRNFGIRIDPGHVSTVVAYVAPGGRTKRCYHLQTLLGRISSQAELIQTHIREDCRLPAVWPCFACQVCCEKESKENWDLLHWHWKIYDTGIQRLPTIQHLPEEKQVPSNVIQGTKKQV
jgi:hypothetical protein